MIAYILWYWIIAGLISANYIKNNFDDLRESPIWEAVISRVPYSVIIAWYFLIGWFVLPIVLYLYFIKLQGYLWIKGYKVRWYIKHSFLTFKYRIQQKIKKLFPPKQMTKEQYEKWYTEQLAKNGYGWFRLENGCVEIFNLENIEDAKKRVNHKS